MAFEIFNKKVQIKGSPGVTFTKMGRLAFNMFATKEFQVKGIEKVLLLWDKETRRVGVKPLTGNDPRSYKLHPGVRGNGCGFSATTFLDHIGYDVSESRSMDALWDDGEKMFVIEVPEEYLKKGTQGTLPSVKTGVRRIRLKDTDTDTGSA